MKIAHFWDLQTFPFMRTCVLSINLGNIRKNRGPLFRTNGNGSLKYILFKKAWFENFFFSFSAILFKNLRRLNFRENVAQDGRSGRLSYPTLWFCLRSIMDLSNIIYSKKLDLKVFFSVFARFCLKIWGVLIFVKVWRKMAALAGSRTPPFDFA